MAPIQKHVLQKVVAHWNNQEKDNHDAFRFGPEQPKKKERSSDPWWKRKLKGTRLYARRYARNILAGETWVGEANYLYEKLPRSDQELLCSLIAYRLLGESRVRLPTNATGFWTKVDRIKALGQDQGSFTVNVEGREIPLQFFDLTSLGHDMKCFSVYPALASIVTLGQYGLPGSFCHIEPGDYVLDAGACWGDSSLFFASLAGPQGRVYSDECLPDNWTVFDENMALNPSLSERIHLQKKALWKRSGEKMNFLDAGPGSHLSTGQSSGGLSAETITIDDWMEQAQIPKLDFIKMDIEGAELAALQGAEKTLQRFRPKLALSVYHKREDFNEIPRYIDSLGLGYGYRLDHFTIHSEETVLYGVAP